MPLFHFCILDFELWQRKKNSCFGQPFFIDWKPIKFVGPWIRSNKLKFVILLLCIQLHETQHTCRHPFYSALTCLVRSVCSVFYSTSNSQNTSESVQQSKFRILLTFEKKVMVKEFSRIRIKLTTGIKCGKTMWLITIQNFLTRETLASSGFDRKCLRFEVQSRCSQSRNLNLKDVCAVSSRISMSMDFRQTFHTREEHF